MGKFFKTAYLNKIMPKTLDMSKQILTGLPEVDAATVGFKYLYNKGEIGKVTRNIAFKMLRKIRKLNDKLPSGKSKRFLRRSTSELITKPHSVASLTLGTAIPVPGATLVAKFIDDALSKKIKTVTHNVKDWKKQKNSLEGIKKVESKLK